MKILYSDLKKLLPQLKAQPAEIGEAYTLTGLMLDGLQEVTYDGKKDTLLSVEVRQNRPDCLSVVGLAQETSAYFKTPITRPEAILESLPDTVPNIVIKDEQTVYRLVAIAMDSVKVTPSPGWLKEYLELQGINSINLLVDLSNYIMLLTGYPNHIFDLNKVEGTLSWGLNQRHEQMMTLGGSTLNLHKDVLIIEDSNNPLAIAGAIGGDIARVDEQTTTILVEIGVYDPALVMRNARSLGISTETSRRLEKRLDPEGIVSALQLLVSLIQKECGGQFISGIFDFYPNQSEKVRIQFDPTMASQIAGVAIQTEEAAMILEHLGCTIEKGDTGIVTPPVGRTDLAIQEDLVEEVVRMFGYNNIPTDEVPALSVVTNITPPSELLTQRLKKSLSVLGYDEVLTLPLVTQESVAQGDYRGWHTINVENAVNEEFTSLRTSLLPGLMEQLTNYLKNDVRPIRIFEVGNIFGKAKKEIVEEGAIAMLWYVHSEESMLTKFLADVQQILIQSGITTYTLTESAKRPSVANPRSCWDIKENGHVIGVIFKSIPIGEQGSAYGLELHLPALVNSAEEVTHQPVVELTQRIVQYDINIEVVSSTNAYQVVDEIRQHIPEQSIWSIEVIDSYRHSNKKHSITYTIRIQYTGMKDQDAKAMHDTLYDTINGAQKGEQS